MLLDIALLLTGLDAGSLPLATEIACLPEGIRGYGHVQAAAIRQVAGQRQTLLGRWSDKAAKASQAA